MRVGSTKRLWIATMMIIAAAGCIPSGPSDTAQPAASQPSPAVGQQVARQLPAADAGKSSMTVTTNSLNSASDAQAMGINVGVQLTPLEGKPGFRIVGSHGLTGTLLPVNPEATEWELKGEFAFDSPGYEVGIPSSTQILTASISQNGVNLQAQGSQYLVTIPVKAPKTAPAAKQVTKVPVTAKVQASKDAQFTVIISQG